MEIKNCKAIVAVSKVKETFGNYHFIINCAGTGKSARTVDKDGKVLPDNVKERLAKQVPFPPRLGKPEEFARLVSQDHEEAAKAFLEKGTI